MGRRPTGTDAPVALSEDEEGEAAEEPLDVEELLGEVAIDEDDALATDKIVEDTP